MNVGRLSVASRVLIGEDSGVIGVAASSTLLASGLLLLDSLVQDRYFAFQERKGNTMIRAQVLLSKSAERKLRVLSEYTGKNRSELIREAVETLVASPDAGDRLRYLRKGRGLWRKRNDLPDFARLRKEWDRA